MFQIDFSAYFFYALVFLSIPLKWTMSIIISAIFHELCHCTAIAICGGSIKVVKIDIGGAVIEASIPGSGKELLCAAAGPAGSLLLVLFCGVVPSLAICGFFQGIVNLLPVYPLDGGRILKCFLELIGSDKTEKILLHTKYVTCLMLTVSAVFLALFFSMEHILIFTCLVLISKVLLRKIPCKRSQIRVQ